MKTPDQSTESARIAPLRNSPATPSNLRRSTPQRLSAIGCALALFLGCSSQSAEAVTLVSSNITSNTTWASGGDNIYEVTADISVAAGSTLTIQPGVTVHFRRYAGLWINGTLNAAGTAASPITFTGTNTAKGWWRGLFVQNQGSATFTHCEMAYAGYYENLTLSKSGSGSLTLTHSTIRDSSDRGLLVTAGYASFVSANNQFRNNVTACQVGINASFDDNTSDFANNTGADVYLDGGTITSDTTWNLKPTYSLYLSGDTAVAAGAKLTIKPGTVLKLAQYVRITIRGQLIARGNAGALIHFTDWRDDSVGGDANKNAGANTPGAGWWRQILILDAGSATFEWCNVAYQGYYEYVGIWKEGSGNLTMANTTVRNTHGDGIRISNSSGPNLLDQVTTSHNSSSGMYINNSQASVTSSTFRDNGHYGLLHEFNDTIVYPNNTFANNTRGSVGVNGGTLVKNLTWTRDIDIVVRGDLIIAAGASLTLEQGVTATFSRYCGLWVDGTLHATGTEEAPITFTGTTLSKGWWRGIQIRAAGSATLRLCEVAYSGYYESVNISKSGSGALILEDSFIHHSSGVGLRVTAGSSEFASSRNRFENNNQGCRIGIGASFDDNTSDFSGNALADVSLDGGSLAQDAIWNLKPDYSFFVSGTYTIGEGATLTIRPGTVVKFAQYTALNVLGHLDAQGTTAERIHFTDWRDDSVGGDANMNAAANSPAPGWWRQILIYNSGSAVFNWCQISYAGYYENIGLWKKGDGALSVRNTTVSHCLGNGIQVSGSSGQNLFQGLTASHNSGAGMYINNSPSAVTGSTFSNNGTYGVHHDVNDTIIYPGNTFTQNTSGSIGVNGGTLNQSLTWTRGVDIMVRGDTIVAAGATLTIEPGVTVRFERYTGLWVDGSLKAIGTPTAKITFTGTSATKGWWRGLKIRGSSSAQLQYCDVAYAGYYETVNILKSGTGSLFLTDSLIRECNGDGLRVTAGSSEFLSARNRFENNNQGCAIGIGASFDDNTSDFSGNTASDVTLNGGTITQDVTWSLKPDYSLLLSSSCTVDVTATLTVAPGTVVKFAQYTSLDIRGQLDAQGTSSRMIHFTDWRDDSVGGDANRNADANAPSAGWWRYLRVHSSGSATLDWCGIAYPGYYEAFGIWKQGTGDLILRNSTVRSVRGDGLLLDGSDGNHEISRSAFLENWKGIRVVGNSAPIVIGGCRFEENISQGSGSYGLQNTSTSVVDARGNWWGHDSGPAHSANPEGTGNRVSDNVLFDPWKLTQSTTSILSPMRSGTLVAGDTLRFTGAMAGTAGAGYRWSLNGSQFSTGRNPGLITFPTPGAALVTFGQAIDGQPDPFPDVRNFTVVPDTGGYPDLRARQMTVPPNLAVGQTTAIHYEVGNVGDAPMTGVSWKDAIYLSDDAWLDSGDIEIGSANVTHELPAGGSYQGMIGVTLPAIDEGTRFLILSVNDTWQVVERHRLNNELANSASVLIPGLVAGMSSGGTLEPRNTAGGHHYRFDLTEPGNLRLHITGNVTIYVRTGGIASTKNFMWQGQAGEDLLLSGLPPGALFIHLVNNLPGSSTDYTLTAERADLLISRFSPPSAGAGVDLNLTVEGIGFAPGLELSLVRGATRVSAVPGSLQVFSSRRLTATFPGASLTPGGYTLEARGPGLVTVQSPGVVSILEAAAPHLTLNLVVPERLGYHGLGTLFVEYGNDGNAPMKAPFILVTSTQSGRRGAIMTLDSSLVSQGFWTSALPAGFATSIQLLGSGEVAGMLMPGEHRRVPVYYTGWLKPWNFAYPPFEFKVAAIHADDTRPVPWQSADNLAGELRPNGMSDAAWSIVRKNLLDSFGTTVGSFVSKIGENATYLENLGERIEDVTRLTEFEVSKARGAFHPLAVLSANTDLETIVPGDLPMLFARIYPHELGARFAPTDLGEGWTHVWDYRMESRVDGMMLLRQPGGALRVFAPDLRGGYLSMPGDPARLTAANGGHRLREKDGNTLQFNADGRLSEVRDRLNHTITLSYAGGLLTRLQHSAGAFLILDHVGPRISSVTDHYGRQVRYAYDSLGRLNIITDPENRETECIYGTTPEAAGALVTVGYPTGVLSQFRYNSQHFVEETFIGNEANPVQSTRFILSGARASVRDALGRTFGVASDHRGLMRIVTDTDNRPTYFTFDRALRNTAVRDAAGFGMSFQHDRVGNTTAVTDATGIRSAFTYNRSHFLASHADGIGQRFDYIRDATGNLLRLQGPDGKSWQWTYHADGLPASFQDKSGSSQHYLWNSGGQLTQMSNANQVVIGSYGYDNANRLNQLSTATDSIQLDYTTGDRIERTLSADGSQLDFGYDSAGRRSFATSNRTGHRVNYHYDGSGRLQRLSDVSESTIVEYSYDAAGRVDRKTFGNGVYTRYETDAYGRITHQGTHRPDHLVISSFDLTYDSAGHLTSHVSDAGTWTMDHDLAGRVTHRSFTAAGETIPERIETFNYDGAGELMRRTYNGESHSITRNAWGLVTSDGVYTYQYDSDGNLVSRSGDDGTVTYAADHDGRVTSMSGTEGTISITYDAAGALKTSTRPGEGTLRWQLDPVGAGPLAILNAAGDPVESYYQGLGMAAKDTTSGRRFPEFDPVTGRQLFETDAAGNMLDSNQPPTPPTGLVIQSRSAGTPVAAYISGIVGGPVSGFGMEPVFPYGTSEIGLIIQAGKAIHNSPYTAKVRSTAADVLRNENFSIGTGLLGITTSGDLMSPLYQGVTRGAGMLHSGLNKLNVVVTGTPDFNGLVGRISQHSGKFDKFGKALGVLGIAGGGVEMYDAIYKGKQVNYDKLSHGFGTAALAGVGIIAAGTAAAPLVAVAGVVAFVSDNTIGLQERFWYWWDGLDPDPGNFSGRSVGSMDPNEMTGPAGYGPRNFRALDSSFAYKIDFENDPSALAPAQIVTITHVLGNGLNRSDFSLTTVGFGDIVVPVGENSGNFFTTVDMSQDDLEMEVEIDISYDPQDGRLVARFTTLDKATGLPPSVDYGFLPAEDGSGCGQGFVSYVVAPHSHLTTGTEIRNVAIINFDFAYDIATNQVDPHDPSKGTDPAKEALVTIDSTAPVSQVEALPAAVKPDFLVQWSGDDGLGCGVASYTVSVSIDGGLTWSVWLADTPLTQAIYNGTADLNYRFNVAARDWVGNTQLANPANATAPTRAIGAAMIAVQDSAGTIIPAETGRMDFGRVRTGTSVTRTFTIRNQGPVVLSGISVGLSANVSATFKVSAPPVQSLPPGGSTTFTVSYSAISAAMHSAVLRVNSNDAHLPVYEIALSGTGVAVPRLGVKAANGVPLVSGKSTIGFGRARTGTSVPKTITLTNHGTAPLTGVFLARTGNHAGIFTTSPARIVSLAPGKSTSVRIAFAPIAKGAHRAVLRIRSNDPATPSFDLALVGTGVAAPKIAVQGSNGSHLAAGKSTIGFGSTKTGTAGVARNIKITNRGIAPLTGLLVRGAGPHSRDFAISPLRVRSLAPGKSATLRIVFKPRARGLRKAALHIRSNDPVSPSFVLKLSGSGVAAPKIEVKHAGKPPLIHGKSTIALGSASTTLTVTNRGLAPLSKLGLVITGGHKADFQITPLKVKSLAPGRNTSFAVTFRPKASGPRNATLLIRSNDPSTASFRLKLTGSGRTAARAPAAMKSPLALPGIGGSAETAITPSSSTMWLAGSKYRCLTIPKPNGMAQVTIEVSSNLVDWFSGPKHTSVVIDSAELLIVRDNIPIQPGTNRYIRVKPRAGIANP